MFIRLKLGPGIWNEVIDVEKGWTNIPPWHIIIGWPPRPNIPAIAAKCSCSLNALHQSHHGSRKRCEVKNWQTGSTRANSTASALSFLDFWKRFYWNSANSSLLRDFDEHWIKKLHKTKSQCFLVTFKFCLCETPDFPSLIQRAWKHTQFWDFWDYAAFWYDLAPRSYGSVKIPRKGGRFHDC